MAGRFQLQGGPPVVASEKPEMPKLGPIAGGKVLVQFSEGLPAFDRWPGAAELPAQRDRILTACARHDASVVSAELHKLKASCGFVGALRLMETVQRLSDSPLDASRAEAFGHAANDTLAAQS